MTKRPDGPLKTGFTTGACATAAAAAACARLLTGEWPDPVSIILPRGQRVDFPLAGYGDGAEHAWASVIKDAGDDPDVTHGALIIASVKRGCPGQGVTFCAGPGVGTVTRPGLPIAPGEPAINPVPRQMMKDTIAQLAASVGVPADFELTISIPDGERIAEKTWNPRLGIEGGLSILGTTGIVRPFSCAAWIASIHRGIDVARASGLTHAVGSTGATSERVAQEYFSLPDHAMLDMGDFAGGMLKYLRRNPMPRVTIAGGFGKLTKLAQGAVDLHSGRSQVDFEQLADTATLLRADRATIAGCNTAKQALDIVGIPLAQAIAHSAQARARALVSGTDIEIDVLVVDRQGAIVAHALQP